MSPTYKTCAAQEVMSDDVTQFVPLFGNPSSFLVAHATLEIAYVTK